MDGELRWMVVMDGPRIAHLDVEKNILLGNVSKTPRHFVLIVSAPHKRVLMKSFKMFKIGEIVNFLNTKISKLLIKTRLCRMENVVHFSTWIYSVKRLIFLSNILV